MKDNFLESVKKEFISQIEEIISETKLSSEEKELNAIDTLILVNDNINSWISTINGVFHIDEELLTKVAELKKPFVTAAKKHIASEIAKIIENEPANVTKKINDFMSKLKEKGINLDEDEKTEDSTTTQKNNANSSSSSSYIKQRALREAAERSRSSCDYSSYSCGGSSGSCGGSGC